MMVYASKFDGPPEVTVVGWVLFLVVFVADSKLAVRMTFANIETRLYLEIDAFANA
jgi:hypothetical protein